MTILAKIWLPWQRALEPYNQKCLIQTGRPPKGPAENNHILVVPCRNAFTVILFPKLVAMLTLLCPLCTVVSQMNSPVGQTLSQNQTLPGYVAYN